jgi:hypothetical protein
VYCSQGSNKKDWNSGGVKKKVKIIQYRLVSVSQVLKGYKKGKTSQKTNKGQRLVFVA